MEEIPLAAGVETMAVQVDRVEGSIGPASGVDGGDHTNSNATDANRDGHAEPDAGELCHWVSPNPRRDNPFMPRERIAMLAILALHAT